MAARPQKTVSVVGAGDMGSALARALLNNKFRTTVWNRSVQKCQPLVAMGASIAPSFDACLAASWVTIVCLNDTKSLNGLLAGQSGSRAAGDKILINFSVGSFQQLDVCSQLVSKLGFQAYIHAAIFSTPPFVGQPETMSYYAGGNEKIFASVERITNSFGRSVYLGSNAKKARFQEILLGGCFFGFATGFLQSMAALRFSEFYTPGAAQDLMSEMVVPLLTHAMPQIFGEIAKQVDKREYVVEGSGGEARLGVLAHALEDCDEVYKDSGLLNTALQPMRGMIKARLADGGSLGEEMSSLIEVIRKPTSLVLNNDTS